MLLARERVQCRAPLAALLIAADVDRVVMNQRVEPLKLVATAKRRSAEMAIDLHQTQSIAPLSGNLVAPRPAE